MTTKTRRAANFAGSGRRADGAALAVRTFTDPGIEGSVSIAVPRRVGNAVARNRIRRQIREILRLGGDRIRPDVGVGITVRTVGGGYGELEDELWVLLDRTGALR